MGHGRGCRIVVATELVRGGKFARECRSVTSRQKRAAFWREVAFFYVAFTAVLHNYKYRPAYSLFV